jgi:hypothetical protein
VQAQRFQEWEAIVVDDGSTDDTPTIVAQFVGPRVRCIRQANRGLSAARNAGIRVALGTYLAFLDADDEWEPLFLERSVRELRKCGRRVAGVYTGTLYIDSDGRLLPQRDIHRIPEAQLRSKLLERGLFPPCTILVRADVVRGVGMFDTRLSGVADMDLWLRITERYTLRGIREALARYRVYQGSMSTDAAHMGADIGILLEKHFGPADGDPATWPEEKRHTYGFRSCRAAVALIGAGRVEEGWRVFARSVQLWPDTLRDLDLFFDLACGDQPRGSRGEARAMDLQRVDRRLVSGLGQLFRELPRAPTSWRRAAYGNAYLALGMLNDQAGRPAAARNYLFRAVGVNPSLLASLPVTRRLLRLCGAPRLADLRRAWHGGLVRALR